MLWTVAGAGRGSRQHSQVACPGAPHLGATRQRATGAGAPSAGAGATLAASLLGLAASSAWPHVARSTGFATSTTCHVPPVHTAQAQVRKVLRTAQAQVRSVALTDALQPFCISGTLTGSGRIAGRACSASGGRPPGVLGVQRWARALLHHSVMHPVTAWALCCRIIRLAAPCHALSHS